MERDMTSCKICLKKYCECVEEFNTREKMKIIEIMGNEKFINLTNEVGCLTFQGFSWVRRTEDGYNFKKIETLYEQVKKLNAKYNIECILPESLAELLSFSSRYWDIEFIDELYHTFYIILCHQNYQQTLEFIKNSSDFPNMRVCIQKNPNQFKRLESLIRII